MTGHPTKSLPQSNVQSEEGLIASSALLQHSNIGFLSCLSQYFFCPSIYSFISFFSSFHLLPHFIIFPVTVLPLSSPPFSPTFYIISRVCLSHPPTLQILYPFHLKIHLTLIQLIKKGGESLSLSLDNLTLYLDNPTFKGYFCEMVCVVLFIYLFLDVFSLWMNVSPPQKNKK